MRIVITGVGGFVGKHTVDHILDRTDWEIIGIDSFRHMGDSERLSTSDRVRTFYHDFNAPMSLRLAQRIGSFDFLINTASLSHVDTSIEDPLWVWQNNTMLIANVLEWCRRMNLVKPIRGIIQCSTDEVFGPAEKGYHHHEWDVVKPSNPYAASKAAQDAFAHSYWRTFGLPVTITHCMNMIGTHQDPEKYLPLLVSRILNGKTIKVHGSAEEVGSRKYLDCRNLADAWIFMIEEVMAGRLDLTYRGTSNCELPKFNVAGEELTNLELLRIVESLLDKEANWVFEDFHSQRPGHDARYSLETHKIEDMGWEPPFTTEECIEEVVKHIQKNHEWREQ